MVTASYGTFWTRRNPRAKYPRAPQPNWLLRVTVGRPFRRPSDSLASRSKYKIGEIRGLSPYAGTKFGGTGTSAMSHIERGSLGGRPRPRLLSTIRPFSNSSPPQIPHNSFRVNAASKHSELTGHLAHMAFARAGMSMAVVAGHGQ